MNYRPNIESIYDSSSYEISGVSKAKSVLCQFCGENKHSNADCRTRTSEFTNRACHAGDFVARRVVDRFNIRPVIHSVAKLFIYTLIKIINTYYH